MKPHNGSLLILTFMLCVMLILEVTLINGIVVRSYSEEGMLRGQNIMARRGLESALSQLEKDLYASLATGGSATSVWNTYKRGGSYALAGVGGQTLRAVNPETSTSVTTDTNVSAWIQEVRGSYYHLVARARVGGVDILSHKWVQLDPCQTEVLTTIVTGARTPGVKSMAVDSTGRVLFAEGSSAGAFLWTWKDNVLSTLLSGVNQLGRKSMLVGPDDRFYIGKGEVDNVNGTAGHMYTYRDGILSTITPSTITGPGFSDWSQGNTSMAVDPGGRFYFGSGESGGKMLTWSGSKTVYRPLWIMQVMGFMLLLVIKRTWCFLRRERLLVWIQWFVAGLYPMD